MLFARLTFLASLAAAVLAEGTYMPILPDEVLADLAKRDPTTYQTYGWQNETQGLAERGPPNNLYGIKTRCPKKSCLNFSFDDGPYHMNEIVDLADAANTKVTFFVNANNYDCIYNQERVDQLKYAYSHGHQICSHTASHPDLNKLSNAEIKVQMDVVDTALWKILGVVPQCMRPPYGDANKRVVKQLNALGYVIITWNYDTQDADGATVAFSENVINQIKAPKHATILTHETVETTVTTLFPYMLKKLYSSGGYTPANAYTIPDGFGFNGYKVVGQPSQRDSTWTCDGMPQPGPN